jgi:hypothetical protein
MDFIKTIAFFNVDVLEYVCSGFTDNYDFMVEIIRDNPEAIMYASDRLRDNKDLATIALNKDGFAINYITDRLKYDDSMVEIAIHTYGRALEFGSEFLRSKKNFVLSAFGVHDPTKSYKSRPPISCISPDLMNKEDFILELLKNGHHIPKCYTPHCFMDKNFLMRAIRLCPDSIRLYFTISKPLNDDIDIIIEFLKKDVDIIWHISKHLSQDRNFIIKCIQNVDIMEFVYAYHKNDKLIVIESVKGFYKSYNHISDELKVDKDFNCSLLKLFDGYDERLLLFEYFNTSMKHDTDVHEIVKSGLKY